MKDGEVGGFGGLGETEGLEAGAHSSLKNVLGILIGIALKV